MVGDYFVFTLMALNFGACVSYGWQGHYIKAVYWTAALLLNFCVLKMK